MWLRLSLEKFKNVLKSDFSESYLMITVFLRQCLWGMALINSCLYNFSEALAHFLQLPGSLESRNCPQTFLQILLAVLCTVLPIARTFFQMWNCKKACCVGLPGQSEAYLRQVSALAFTLAAAHCKFNTSTFFPLQKMLIHKKIVQKFTESQEKSGIH